MEARNRVKVANNALPVLIGRAGGSVTVSRAEFDEVAGHLAAGRRRSRLPLPTSSARGPAIDIAARLC